MHGTWRSPRTVASWDDIDDDDAAVAANRSVVLALVHIAHEFVGEERGEDDVGSDAVQQAPVEHMWMEEVHGAACVVVAVAVAEGAWRNSVDPGHQLNADAADADAVPTDGSDDDRPTLPKRRPCLQQEGGLGPSDDRWKSWDKTPHWESVAAGEAAVAAAVAAADGC